MFHINICMLAVPLTLYVSHFFLYPQGFLNLMFYIWYFKLNSDKSYYETFYFENERNIHLKSLY